MKLILTCLTLIFPALLLASGGACKLKPTVPYPANLDVKKSECQDWNKQENQCYERVCVSEKGSMYCEQSADKKVKSAISCN